MGSTLSFSNNYCCVSRSGVEVPFLRCSDMFHNIPYTLLPRTWIAELCPPVVYHVYRFRQLERTPSTPGNSLLKPWNFSDRPLSTVPPHANSSRLSGIYISITSRRDLQSGSIFNIRILQIPPLYIFHQFSSRKAWLIWPHQAR